MSTRVCLYYCRSDSKTEETGEKNNMLKDFFAFYGAMRLLDDFTKTPSGGGGGGDKNEWAGCGCLVFFIVLFLLLESC